MNLFIFSPNLKHSAEYFFNRDPRRARKQIVEAVQMIAMAVEEFGLRSLKTTLGKNYQWTKAQFSHPVSKWVREKKENFLWTVAYVYNLELYYFLKTGKFHRSYVSMAEALARTGIPATLQPEGTTCPPFVGKEEFLTHPVDVSKLNSVYEKYQAYLDNKLHFERRRG